MKRFAVMSFQHLAGYLSARQLSFQPQANYIDFTTCQLSFTINMEITHCGH
jgi:hypothetical protein